MTNYEAEILHKNINLCHELHESNNQLEIETTKVKKNIAKMQELKKSALQKIRLNDDEVRYILGGL